MVTASGYIDRVAQFARRTKFDQRWEPYLRLRGMHFVTMVVDPTCPQL
jgi:hypothetical protein